MGTFTKSIQRSWSRHFVGQVSAILILTITYATALFTVLSAVTLKEAMFRWGKIGQATVYLQPEISESQKNQILTTLSSKKFIKNVKYISPKQSAIQFEEKYQKLLPKENVEGSFSEFFPSSIYVELAEPIKSAANAEQIERFSFSLKEQFAFVEEVSFGQTWIYKYTRVIEFFEDISLWIGFTLLLASLFVTSNVLKSVLYSRKEELEILEMVGATPLWVFGPHILNCCLLSGISLFFALLLNSYAFSSIAQVFQSTFEQIVWTQNFASTQYLFLMFSALFILLSVFLVNIFGVRGLRSRDPQRRQKKNIYRRKLSL